MADGTWTAPQPGGRKRFRLFRKGDEE
jgi:hypothetical protein